MLIVCYGTRKQVRARPSDLREFGLESWVFVRWRDSTAVEYVCCHGRAIKVSPAQAMAPLMAMAADLCLDDANTAMSDTAKYWPPPMGLSSARVPCMDEPLNLPRHLVHSLILL